MKAYLKMTPTVLSQEEAKAIFLPIIQDGGKPYRKNKQVKARPAIAGERITTNTSDGAETTNQADAGDFIIQNQTEAKEEYIIGGEKFHERYVLEQELTGEWNIYQSIGKISVIELSTDLLEELKLTSPFYFGASWGENMIAKAWDFIVSRDPYTEVYRIARKEFFETYVAI